MKPGALGSLTALALLTVAAPAAAQFRDDFAGKTLAGWTFFTGDGAAVMDFRPANGVGLIAVDATRDRDNIWYALIKRDVSSALDLARLARPGHELRLAVRLRASHAPRRVNLHANTQKTTDFHTHLMEYDLPDTLWHTITMTTRGFRAGPGDQVNVQLALMDWGLGHYRVVIDWYRADVVDAAEAGPDLGEPLPYQPPIGDLARFREVLEPVQAAIVDEAYPDLGFAGWYLASESGVNAADGTGGAKQGPTRERAGAAGPKAAPAAREAVLGVGGGRSVILRWDLRPYAGRRAAGPAVLELATRSLQRMSTDPEELGQVRVVEILGGDPAWERNSVTLTSLRRGRPLAEVFNGQMASDARVAEDAGGRTHVVLPRPVLKRLLDGRTLGLAIRPLGPIDAVFYGPGAAAPGSAPRLYFNVE